MQDETAISIYGASVVGSEYDRACKAVWKHKEIMAPLLKFVIEEYKDSSIEDIIHYIDADTISEDVPVSDIPPVAIDRGTELSSLTDKVSQFDMNLKAKNPLLSDKDLLVMLHIDTEFQTYYRPRNPSYPVIKRAIYYGARQLCRQLGTVTGQTNYSSLEKVYSIWVCSEDIPSKLKNTITRYVLKREDVEGICDEPKSDYDLMEIVIVRRGQEDSEAGTLFDYLNAVFNSDIDKIDTYVRVSDDPEIREEVAKMPGMGAAIAEKNYNSGRRDTIVSQVCKKLRKGKTVSQIADELEENDMRIQVICDSAAQFAPEYDEKKVSEALDNLE